MYSRVFKWAVIMRWSTFVFSCCLCQRKVKSLRDFFCFSCSLFFAESVPLSSRSVTSLFTYNKEIRSLILLAKVRSSKRAVFCLTKLFSEHLAVQAAKRQVDFVMPAPSSLYSRLAGRFDLAYFLARELADDGSCAFVSSPVSLSFSLSKRTKGKRAGEFYDLRVFKSKAKGKKPRILIVDDVLTTGYTLHRLGLFLEKSYDLNFITLACARLDEKPLIISPKTPS